MKAFVKFLFLLFLVPVIAHAQKDELVNSGEAIKKALTLYDSSQYKSALTELNRINRSDTNYVYSLYLKALNCEADSQYKQAVKYCREGLALKDQREYEPDLFNTWGNTLNDMKDHDAALRVFNEAIKKYPSSALLCFNKGIVYMGMEKPADAEPWFKQALLINPYMYSAHYRLALAALLQGKIVPSVLGFMGYLMVDPDGKNYSSAIKILVEIANSNDEILNLKSKRSAEPGEDYATVEEILLSKIALDKQYKPIIAMDDPLTRQLQVVFEKLDYQENDNDFWMQYYVPFYKKLFAEGKFEPFINHIFSETNVAAIKEYNKRNKKAIEQIDQDAQNYFDQIRMTRELFYKKRDTVSLKYVFNNGELSGKGRLTASGKDVVGPWQLYYKYGNLKAVGNFTTNGERDGDWTFYYFSGKLKSHEHYVNGKLQGKQEYYYENGNLSSTENYVNGLAEGPIYVYYFTGGLKKIMNYKLDKKSGETKIYYNGGVLNQIENYSDDKLNGLYTEYYKNGNKQQTINYTNGKEDGSFKMYYETGELNYEGNYVADKAQGEWKYYYKNGKLKQKRNYVNDSEQGPHEEYFETGELSMSCNVVKDKIHGELTEYYKDGKPYIKSQYESGVPKSIKYFDESGKVLSASTVENGLLGEVEYGLDGKKKGHSYYDKKGNLTGVDTIFYPSGKVYQVNYYKDGQFDGPTVTYYQNGKIKYQIGMSAGKENGHYISYYTNGKLQSDGWRTDDENNGPWAYYDEQGRLTTTAYYANGEENGYKETFTPDGKKTTEEKYLGGTLEQIIQYNSKGDTINIDSFPKYSGKYKVVYPDGKVMAEANYVNGNFDGVFKEYFFDGSISRVFYYKSGMLDSTYTSYYYGGIKSSEGSYKFNNKTGVWKSYGDEGYLLSETAYASDMMNGIQTDYFENVKDRICTYKDDKLEGDMKKYDLDGSLAYSITFSDDNPQSYSYLGKDGKMVANIPIPSISGPLKAYYTNGKVSREWAYSDNVKDGTDVIYYASGQMRSIDTLAYNMLQGTSKEYFPNGKLKYEYHYDTDNLNGICRDYWENGNLKEESVFDNGNYNGPAKFYDENGKLIKTLIYKYGLLVSAQIEK